MVTLRLEAPGRLALASMESPVAPGAGEALVRIHRVGVCGTDLHAFGGRQPFFSYPRILGHELGVEVLERGNGVETVAVGDHCSVEPYLNCGVCIACRRGKPNCCAQLKVLGVHTDGGMREQLLVPARKLHRSAQLSFDQLALVETLGIGCHAVDRARIDRDEYALVIGAGPIGLAVMQFAVEAGARVIVLDINEARLRFCQQQLGVAHTLLATAGPVVDALLQLTGGDLPTVVFDATGNSKSMMAAFDYTSPGGRLVFVGLFQGDVTFNDPNFHRRELTIMASRNALPGTFREVIRLVEERKVDTRPWITHRLGLADVPRLFPKDIAGNPAVLKAIIEVG